MKGGKIPSNKPEYASAYQKIWYAANKKKHIAACNARREKQTIQNRKNTVEYLKSHPCVDCGETDILVLQFDHVRGRKRADVGNMIRTGYSWETILKEIEKCEVRCANDHIRRTMRVRKSYRVLEC